MMRVLVGGVGYRNLRDHSCGVVLIDRLAERNWPAHVSMEDLSYNPIAVVQRLEDDPPDRRFDLAIIVGALPRPGRKPGTLSVYRWDDVLPEPNAIHEAVTEAVTGIISLDNTLIVARQLGALPPTVIVIEIEPEAHEFGDELTPSVAVALDHVTCIITALTACPASALDIAEGSLAGPRVRHSGVVWEKVDHGATLK